MDSHKAFKHNLAVIGEGALLIWWGLVIMIDPLTIGIGAVGTGLIFLGANAARMLKGLPQKAGNTLVGILAIVWGMLDHVFALRLGASFALLLILIGLTTLLAPLFAHPKFPAESHTGDV